MAVSQPVPSPAPGQVSSTPTATSVKPWFPFTLGAKSSEFFITVAVQIVAILDEAGVWNYAPSKYALLAQSIVGGLYALSRGWAKSKPAP